MTRTELETYAAQTLMNRPELLATVSPETEPKIRIALRRVHQAMQRDSVVDRSRGFPITMAPDWACLITTPSDQTFTAGAAGILLTEFDDLCDRVLNVWEVNDDGVAIPVEPATQDQINDVARYENREFANKTVPSGVYHQRWYIDDGYLKLLSPPETGDDDLTIRARVRRQLAFYASDSATDWFSANVPDALAWGAAYYGSIFIGDDERAGAAKGLWEEAWIKALRENRRNTKGGLARVWCPPLAQGRKF